MSESQHRSVPVGLRDARPFLAFHLRRRADESRGENAEVLDLVARWVENLPARDPRMQRIEQTDALDYADGSFHGGVAADGLIDECRNPDPSSWNHWLDEFAGAVERDWRRR